MRQGRWRGFSAQAVGRQRAELGKNEWRSNAFTAARNKGLNVSFEVKGNSSARATDAFSLVVRALATSQRICAER